MERQNPKIADLEFYINRGYTRLATGSGPWLLQPEYQCGIRMVNVRMLHHVDGSSVFTANVVSKHPSGRVTKKIGPKIYNADNYDNLLDTIDYYLVDLSDAHPI
jgi:hypothetical protein